MRVLPVEWGTRGEDRMLGAAKKLIEARLGQPLVEVVMPRRAAVSVVVIALAVQRIIQLKCKCRSW